MTKILVNRWNIIYLNCRERYEDMTDHLRVYYELKTWPARGFFVAISEAGVPISQCNGSNLALACSYSMFYPVRVRTVKKRVWRDSRRQTDEPWFRPLIIPMTKAFPDWRLYSIGCTHEWLSFLSTHAKQMIHDAANTLP